MALSYIARRWMLRKAKAVGLPIHDSAITACDDRIDPGASLQPPKDPIQNEYRSFLKGDRFHYTVQDRPDHNNLPQELVNESQDDEMHAVRIQDLTPRETASAK